MAQTEFKIEDRHRYWAYGQCFPVTDADRVSVQRDDGKEVKLGWNHGRAWTLALTSR